MKTLFPWVIMIIGQSLFAQQHPAKILVTAGKRVSDVITSDMKFLNKNFKTGTVLFNSGKNFEAKLNYDIFDGGEMVFIGPKGDTLSIVKDQLKNIKLITIDTNSFVCSNGCMILVLENKAGNLAKKEFYTITSREKVGAYNISSPIDAVDSYSSITDQGNNLYSLIVRENITFELKKEYFISDQFNHLYLIANKKNIDKLFFEKRSQLDAYYTQHAVDFKNENDLKMLLASLNDSF